MIRISTIFIAICMVLVAASLGMVLVAVAGFTVSAAAIVALGALTMMILYNAVSMRLRDSADVSSGQIADLSNGTADLARQVAEFGRRLAAVEGKIISANSANHDRILAVQGEINELGHLVRQLAGSVATHDELLAARPAPPPLARAPQPAPVEEFNADEVGQSVAEHAPAPPETPGRRSAAQLLGAVRGAVEAGRIDLYLQPMVTLPQRKVRFYEAVTRLRDADEQVIGADDFIPVAEAAGLMGQIDHAVMLRSMQVLRRLMVRNKDVGVFCNVAAATLRSRDGFTQCLDFLEANRALASSFVLEFKQSTLRNLDPVAIEHLAALAQRGFRFSIDHVTDLRIEPRELADRGVRYIKVPAALLLDPREPSASDIHAADLSDLLGRYGIDLIAERIEGERAVVDLLDYDVRFGQGFLFAAPRPLRPEGAEKPATAASEAFRPDGNGATRPALDIVRQDPNRPDPNRQDAPRATGNAALARRALGPG
jgi:cyclic-di-GMP phosphodiesterase TipF (flagellum assembly factor)